MSERKYLLSVDTDDMPGKAKLTFVHFTEEIVGITDERNFLSRKFPLLAADSPEIGKMRHLISCAEGLGHGKG